MISQKVEAEPTEFSALAECLFPPIFIRYLLCIWLGVKFLPREKLLVEKWDKH